MTISVVPAISLGALRALQAAVTSAKAIVAIAACRLAFALSPAFIGVFCLSLTG